MAKQICPECGKIVSDLRRHLQRGRCGLKGPMSDREKMKAMRRSIRR